MKKIIIHIMLVSFVVSSSQALISDHLKKMYNYNPTLCAGSLGFLGGYGLKKALELISSPSDLINTIPLLFGIWGMSIATHKSHLLKIQLALALGILLPNKWWDKLGNIPVLKTGSKWIKPFKCVNKECKGICHNCKLQTMFAWLFATGVVSNLKNVLLYTFFFKNYIPTDCSICRKTLAPQPSILTHNCGHAFHANCFTGALKKSRFKHICPVPRCDGDLINQPKEITFGEEKTKTKTNLQEISDTECAICKTDFEDNIEIKSSLIQCNHYFHSQCLLNWLEYCKSKNQDGSCPTCRSQVSYQAYINGQPI